MRAPACDLSQLRAVENHIGLHQFYGQSLRRDSMSPPSGRGQSEKKFGNKRFYRPELNPEREGSCWRMLPMSCLSGIEGSIPSSCRIF